MGGHGHAQVKSAVAPTCPPMVRCAAYKEQEKQKSLENAAKRAVKGGNAGADEPRPSMRVLGLSAEDDSPDPQSAGAEAEAGEEDEEEADAAGGDEAEPQSKRQRTEGDDEDAEAE